MQKKPPLANRVFSSCRRRAVRPFVRSLSIKKPVGRRRSDCTYVGKKNENKKRTKAGRNDTIRIIAMRLRMELAIFLLLQIIMRTRSASLLSA